MRTPRNGRGPGLGVFAEAPVTRSWHSVRVSWSDDAGRRRPSHHRREAAQPRHRAAARWGHRCSAGPRPRRRPCSGCGRSRWCWTPWAARRRCWASAPRAGRPSGSGVGESLGDADGLSDSLGDGDGLALQLAVVRAAVGGGGRGGTREAHRADSDREHDDGRRGDLLHWGSPVLGVKIQLELTAIIVAQPVSHVPPTEVADESGLDQENRSRQERPFTSCPSLAHHKRHRDEKSTWQDRISDLSGKVTSFSVICSRAQEISRRPRR